MMLSAHGVSCQLAGRSVLHSVDLSLQSGQVVGLIGANGAGKTTLLRCLAGLQPEMQGQVQLDGVALTSERIPARQLAYVPQRPFSQWNIRVEEIVALGRLPHMATWQTPRAADAEAIAAAMEETGVSALSERAIHSLSGGEQARVFLARALATRASWLLADEPVAGLDAEHQLALLALFRRKAAEGAGILLSLHDLSLAARFCDRLVLLEKGRVLAAGEPEDVLTEAHVEAALRVTFTAILHEGRKIPAILHPINR